LTEISDLLNPLRVMACVIQDIGHLPRESVRTLQNLFPLFEEKSFSFELITGRPDSSIVWFERVHDRRRYSITLGSNGLLRLRRYDWPRGTSGDLPSVERILTLKKLLFLTLIVSVLVSTWSVLGAQARTPSSSGKTLKGKAVHTVVGGR
jgi:hypothetical protein